MDATCTRAREGTLSERDRLSQPLAASRSAGNLFSLSRAEFILIYYVAAKEMYCCDVYPLALREGNLRAHSLMGEQETERESEKPFPAISRLNRASIRNSALGILIEKPKLRDTSRPARDTFA